MVKAGTITKAQGDALKARVEAGDLPLFAGPQRGSATSAARAASTITAARSRAASTPRPRTSA